MQTCIASFGCHFFLWSMPRHFWQLRFHDGCQNFDHIHSFAPIDMLLLLMFTQHASHIDRQLFASSRDEPGQSCALIFPTIIFCDLSGRISMLRRERPGRIPAERHKSPCEELGLVIDGDTRQDTCPTSRSLQLAQISSKIYCSCFSFRVDIYPHLASSRRGLTRQKTNTSLDFWCGNLV
jgi:hypothetical protein